MSKVEVQIMQKAKRSEPLVREIPDGTWFTGVIGSSENMLAIKSGTSVIRVTPPWSKWTVIAFGAWTVSDYCPCDVKIIATPCDQ